MRVPLPSPGAGNTQGCIAELCGVDLDVHDDRSQGVSAGTWMKVVIVVHTSRNRSAGKIATVFVALVLGTVVAPAAQADVPGLNTHSCDGQTYDHSLGSYSNDQGDLPLRCGNSRFGLNHIIARGHFDADTNFDIQQTLSYGLYAPGSSGSKTLYDANCTPVYFVLFGYNAYNGSDPLANPIGIVNAYKIDSTINTRSTSSTTAAPIIQPPYGTGCPVYTPIEND